MDMIVMQMCSVHNSSWPKTVPIDLCTGAHPPSRRLSLLAVLVSSIKVNHCYAEGTVISHAVLLNMQTAVCLCFENSRFGEQEFQTSRPQTHRRCAVERLTLFGMSSLSTSVRAGHVRELSVPLLCSQACRVTWPAAGINAIMAFACIAAQFRAASQGNSAAHSRQAGSTAHNRQAGRRRQHRSSQQHTGKLLNT